METAPKRKSNRLRGFDYSQNAAYFLTICTQHRKPLFWSVGAHSVRPLTRNRCDPRGPSLLPALSAEGCIVERAIWEIPVHYPAVQLVKYAVMPNHVHLLLLLQGDGRTLCAPTVSRVVKHWKEAVTKQLGRSVWQKSFHDHVVRGQADWETIWQYIDANPQTWESDCFYLIESTD